MITDQVIKKEFLSRTLQEEAEWISKRQQKVVRDWGLVESGKLLRSLTNFFSYREIDGGGVLTLRYLNYFRFLDIKAVKKRKKGLHLYNRLVFGRVYGTTQRIIKFGFISSVEETIRKELEQAANSLNK